MSLFDYVKNAIIILLFLQIAPSLFEGIKQQFSHYLEPKTRVGVVPIKGVLYEAKTMVKQIKKFFNDPEIKAVLLLVESPGGAPGTAQLVYQEISHLKSENPHKPIIALVENICASGGYYIASACDQIVAPGAALVGSIGAYFPYLFELNQFIEQFKIGYTSIKAGQYKAITDPFLPKNESDKALLQSVVDDTYDQFVRDVAAKRKLSVDTAPQWAEGKIFTARQAQQLKLIDVIGGAHSAEALIKEKGLIDGKIEWVHAPKSTGLFKMLTGQESDSEDSMLSMFAHKLCEVIMTWCTPRVQA